MKKQRIIVLGSNSFIAKSVISKLSNKRYIFIKLTRQKINLAKNSSIKKLKKIHKNKDIVLVAVNQNWKLINFADQEMRKNKEEDKSAAEKK